MLGVYGRNSLCGAVESCSGKKGFPVASADLKNQKPESSKIPAAISSAHSNRCRLAPRRVRSEASPNIAPYIQKIGLDPIAIPAAQPLRKLNKTGRFPLQMNSAVAAVRNAVPNISTNSSFVWKITMGVVITTTAASKEGEVWRVNF